MNGETHERYRAAAGGAAQGRGGARDERGRGVRVSRDSVCGGAVRGEPDAGAAAGGAVGRGAGGDGVRADGAQGRLPAAVCHAVSRGGDPGRGVPEPECVDARSGCERAAGAGLDSRRVVHERVVVGGRVRRRGVRPRRRGVREHQLPAGRRGVPVPGRWDRQPRAARPDGCAAVGAGQHLVVRRGSGAGHGGGRIGRGYERDHVAVDAAGFWAVCAGYRGERGGGAHADRLAGADGGTVPGRGAGGSG